MTYVYCGAGHHLSALGKDAWKEYDGNEECMTCGWYIYIDQEGYYFQYNKEDNDYDKWHYKHVDCYERSKQ